MFMGECFSFRIPRMPCSLSVLLGPECQQCGCATETRPGRAGSLQDESQALHPPSGFQSPRRDYQQDDELSEFFLKGSGLAQP